MKKEPKDNNLSNLLLNCIIYSFIGIYYDYFLMCNILFVRGITGTELTDWSRIVCIVLIIALGAIPAGMLISKFKTWLFSLPLQYILYFVILVVAEILHLTEAWGADPPLIFHLQISLGLLLLQLPGVVVGHFIRKDQARKNASN